MSIIGKKTPRTAAAIEQTITTALLQAGALLRIDHCRMEIAEYSSATGRLILRIDASCPDCEVSPATFMPAIEAHVKQRVPEVLEVSVIAQ
jgi:Fe-S cluster biogenesis protein NfuA